MTEVEAVKALCRADTLLSMKHGLVRLDNVWGWEGAYALSSTWSRRSCCYSRSTCVVVMCRRLIGWCFSNCLLGY